MICDAHIFTERIRKNETITEREILQVEVYLKKGCPHYRECADVLNQYLIRKEMERREREHPTIQEQDRRSWASKKNRKTSATTTGFSAAVRRLVGRLKKGAGLR